MAAAIIHVIGEWLGWRTTRAAGKLAASTAFVILAVANGAANSAYGQRILIALILSLLGDMLLLSLRQSFLLAGISAFFLAHVAFAAAFYSQSASAVVFAVSCGLLIIVGVAFLTWLWRYLDRFNRVAVPVYLVAIATMVSLAFAVSFQATSVTLAVAATSFAASDVSVALDRFVERKIANKIWGIPLYYAAQIMLAVSVIWFAR